MIGSLYCANDIQELQFVINRRSMYKSNQVKVIVIDDENINQANYIGGSILLPPPDVIYHLIDSGNRMEFANMYNMYLNSQEVLGYIAIIIAALFKGNDIILYTHSSDESMFLPELLMFLRNMGLIVTSIQYPMVPGIDLYYRDFIISFMEQMGYTQHVLFPTTLFKKMDANSTQTKGEVK